MQTPEISPGTYGRRLTRLQAAQRQLGLSAVVLEPGFAMLYLEGPNIQEVLYDENGGVAWP